MDKNLFGDNRPFDLIEGDPVQLKDGAGKQRDFSVWYVYALVPLVLLKETLNLPLPRRHGG